MFVNCTCDTCFYNEWYTDVISPYAGLKFVFFSTFSRLGKTERIFYSFAELLNFFLTKHPFCSFVYIQDSVYFINASEATISVFL